MQQKVSIQKAKMEIALKWLSIIETCEQEIEAGNKEDFLFYIEEKQDAVNAYSETMASLVDSVAPNIENFSL